MTSIFGPKISLLLLLGFKKPFTQHLIDDGLQQLYTNGYWIYDPNILLDKLLCMFTCLLLSFLTDIQIYPK